MTEPLWQRGRRLLAEMVRAHPGPFSVAVGGAALFALASVLGAVALGRATDRLVLDGDAGADRTSVVVAGGVLVGLAAGRAIGVVARRYFGLMTTRRMQMDWYDRLADHYLDQPLPFFDDQPTGKLLAHADNDAERSVFVMQPLPLSLGAALLIVFASINLAILDPLLLLVGLALFPTLIVLNQRYTAQVEEPMATAQAQVGSVSGAAHESFEGALVVKLLGIADAERDRMAGASLALRDTRLTIGRMRAWFEPGLDALPSLGTVALLAVGAWRVSEGAVTTGDLVQAMALFGILVFPMRVVGFLFQELPRSVVARERIVEVLDTDHSPAPQAADTEPADRPRRPLPTGQLDVRVRGLAAGYGGTNVIGGVDLDVAAGSVVAVVGATGSGKSTLCNVLAGVARPTEGSVLLGGVDLDHAEPAAVRRAIALVFQETFLFGDSVRENLTMGATTADEALAWAIDLAQAGFVHELAHGLETMVGERGVTLSGGQRQRIALARAMLRRPRLLILDDATSAIDPVVEERILDGLRSSLDTTTVVVAHRLATIALAEKVAFMDDGTITAVGSHTDLLAGNEGYAALVRAYEDAS